ncbi:hypothetical protein [Limnobacter litoralis]|uniref:DUF3168 domain-containing protein n=1 Tax=Limnobacter litoralis TaxID=481366 RepID=A0ABQ5YPM2_9BURK|nr:hypothetical protein [Limnobacter litoralis]GLR26513.1 hypothetical protein GCM10007875_16030 [Limnobacter litoralis]
MQREQIYKALFDLIGGVSNFVTKSRKLKFIDEMSRVDMPALFQVQVDETPSTTTGQPTRWTLSLELYVYVDVGEDESVSPSEVMNPILDSITNAFDPSPVSARQTLGGLVHYARIGGQIRTGDGATQSQAIAIIPVEIMVA